MFFTKLETQEIQSRFSKESRSRLVKALLLLFRLIRVIFITLSQKATNLILTDSSNKIDK